MYIYICVCVYTKLCVFKYETGRGSKGGTGGDLHHWILTSVSGCAAQHKGPCPCTNKIVSAVASRAIKHPYCGGRGQTCSFLPAIGCGSRSLATAVPASAWQLRIGLPISKGLRPKNIVYLDRFLSILAGKGYKLFFVVFLFPLQCIFVLSFFLLSLLFCVFYTLFIIGIAAVFCGGGLFHSVHDVILFCFYCKLP